MMRFFDTSLDWLWPWATVLSGLSRSFELGRAGRPGPSSLHFGKLVLHKETLPLPTTSLHVLGHRTGSPQTSWTKQLGLGLDDMGAPAGAGTIDAVPRSCLQDG